MVSSSRKRSCAACVEGKRKCDLDLPICERCARTGRVCVYPWYSLEQPANFGGLNTPESNVQYDAAGDFGGQLFDNEASDASALIHVPPQPSLTVPMPLVPGMLSQLDPYLDHGHGMLPMDLTMGLAESAPWTPHPTTYGSDDLDPGEGDITTGSIYQPRTEYVGRRFSMQPQLLAETGQTAFIHHSQVASSEVLQEALAASALHCMRNTTNAVLIRSEIARRVARLIYSIQTALGQDSRINMLPILQALLIYQCIRLFSDDISERAQAERDEIIIRAITSASYIQLKSFSQPVDDWASWVEGESFRRTILVAELLAGIYAFLKQGWDEAEARVLRLKFTAQGALWEARSAAEWHATWIRGPKLETCIRTWDEDTRDALAGDFDDLGIIMRALHHGLESLEHWLGGQRPMLVRWGLRAAIEGW
ncbi:Transcription factor gsfR2 [Cladobotryum mycophilum]|uniref:Transcription factor gsfR2 n=1 Tax=Cladobotryum mycophilum TaxID=491253 RepID=A0ABR0SI66_9HYPO